MAHLERTGVWQRNKHGDGPSRVGVLPSLQKLYKRASIALFAQ